MSLPACCPPSLSGALHAASLPPVHLPSSFFCHQHIPRLMLDPSGPGRTCAKAQGVLHLRMGVAQASGPQGHVRRHRRAPVGTRLEMLQVTETPCSPPTAASPSSDAFSRNARRRSERMIYTSGSCSLPLQDKPWPSLSVSPNLRLVLCNGAVRPALLIPRQGPNEASTRATP